jgi:uncharacterized OsmC-like protein
VILGVDMKYSVEYLGALRTKVIHLDTGCELLTDAPKDNHGQGEMFSPTDLFAASLATCMMTLMGIAAKKLHVDLSMARMDVEKTMQLNPRRIGKITIHFTCSHAVDDEQRLALEKAAYECPVHKSLHPDIIVTTTFIWGS